MNKYQHANIVRFFGVSFDSPGQQCLVLEMMDQGNLRDYLHRARPRIAPDVAVNVFAAAAICAAGDGAVTTTAAAAANNTAAANNNNNSCSEGSSMDTSTTSTALAGSNVITLTAQLDLPALIGIMRDLVSGCKYLEDKHFVHRDIAARNCLVSHNHASGRIVKLCDFGLARDIYKNDYYRKRNEPKLPVRWMSPEAIRDGLFTTKSDVWAFAVTCWEVLTLGADPFYGRANVDVMNLVIGGHVLGRPENCPEELYNQLLQCWSRFTEMRPTFQQLSKKMEEFVLASQNNQSPFSAPFIVSLPLPKSLPGSSCQQVYDATTKLKHQESNDKAPLDKPRSTSDFENSLNDNIYLSRQQAIPNSTCTSSLSSMPTCTSSTTITTATATTSSVKPNATKSYPVINNTQGYTVTLGPEALARNKYNYDDFQLVNPSVKMTKLGTAYETINQTKLNQTKDSVGYNSNKQTNSNGMNSIRSKSKSLLVKSDSASMNYHNNHNNMLMMFSNNRSGNYYPHPFVLPSNHQQYQHHHYQQQQQQQHHHNPHPLHHSHSQNNHSRPFYLNSHKFGPSAIDDGLMQQHFEMLNKNSNFGGHPLPTDGFKTFGGHRSTVNSLAIHDPAYRNRFKYPNEVEADNRALTTHWMVKTGGGQDSLGYEKPSIVRSTDSQPPFVQHPPMVGGQEAHFLQPVKLHHHLYLHHHHHHHHEALLNELAHANRTKSQQNATTENDTPDVHNNMADHVEN